MAKQTSRTSSRSKNSKNSSTDKLNNPNPGRTRPMVPKAGYTQNRRRYNNGGELSYCY